MLLELLVYFALGAVADYFVTLQQRAVFERWVYRATGLTFIIIVLSMGVLTAVVRSNEWSMILAYALGASMGTLAGMKLHRS